MKGLFTPQVRRTVEHAQMFDQQIQVKPLSDARDEIVKLMETVSDEIRVQRFAECLGFLPERIIIELFIHFRRTFYEIFESSEATRLEKGKIAADIADTLTSIHHEVAMEISQRALVELRQGAREALERQDPTSYAKHQFLLARVFAIRNKPDLAIRALKNVLLKAPESERAMTHFQLGCLYADRKKRKDDQQRAEKHLRQAIEFDPNHQNAITRLAELYEEQGDRLKAIKFLEDKIEQMDEEKVSSSLLNTLGSLYFAEFSEYKNETDNRIDRLRGSRRTKLADSGNEYFHGLMNSRVELLFTLETPYGRVPEVDESGKAIPNRERRRLKLERIDELEYVIENTKPDELFMTQTEHGKYLTELDEVLSMIRTFRKNGNPLVPAVLNFRRALVAPDLFAPCLLNLGASLYYMGREKEALQTYEKALEHQLYEAHYRLACFFINSVRFKDHGRSRRELQQYRACYPGNKEIDQKAARLEAHIDQLSNVQ